MPTYVAKCAECGAQQDFVRTVAERDSTPEHCGVAMSRQGAWAVAPQVSAMAWTGHKGFAHGSTFIEDGGKYKEFMRRHDYIPESEGAREAEIQATNKARADDQKLESAVTTAVIGHN